MEWKWMMSTIPRGKAKHSFTRGTSKPEQQTMFWNASLLKNKCSFISSWCFMNFDMIRYDVVKAVWPGSWVRVFVVSDGTLPLPFAPVVCVRCWGSLYRNPTQDAFNKLPRCTNISHVYINMCLGSLPVPFAPVEYGTVSVRSFLRVCIWASYSHLSRGHPKR